MDNVRKISKENNSHRKANLRNNEKETFEFKDQGNSEERSCIAD